MTTSDRTPSMLGEDGELELLQRSVLRLMLDHERDAVYALQHTDEQCFPSQILRACFAAFRRVPLTGEGSNPIDVVLWKRELDRLLLQRGLSVSGANTVAELVEADIRVPTIDRAVGHLQGSLASRDLNEVGTALVRAGDAPWKSPQELAAEAIARLRSIQDRTSPQDGGRLAKGGTIADLVEREPLPPPWLIEGWVRQGELVVLGGEAGVGKTWLVLQIAQAVGGGNPLLGRPCARAPVCVVLLETPDWSLLARAKALGLGDWAKEVHHVTPTTLGCSRIDITCRQDLNALIAWVRRVGAGLLILDPLTFVHSREELDASDLRPVLEALNEVRLESGATVMVTHHPRKGSSRGYGVGDGLDFLRGSSTLGAAADVVLRLKKERGQLRLHSPKQRAAAAPEAMWLARTSDGPLEPVAAPNPGTSAKAGRIAATAEVLRKAAGWLSSTEIACLLTGGGLDVKQVTVRSQYLKQLMATGAVERRGEGKATRYRWKGEDTAGGSKRSNLLRTRPDLSVPHGAGLEAGVTTCS